MIEVLSKPADQISIGDIESLIDSQVPESEQIEFKESLPARKNSTDPWIEGNNTIGNPGKKQDTRGSGRLCKCVWRRLSAGCKRVQYKTASCCRNFTNPTMCGIGGTSEVSVPRLCRTSTSPD